MLPPIKVIKLKDTHSRQTWREYRRQLLQRRTQRKLVPLPDRISFGVPETDHVN